MKQMLYAAIAATLLFTACKKSSSTTPTTPTTTTTTIPTDGWKMGTTHYTQAYCLRQSGQFALNCVDGTTGTIHSFAAFFKAYPTADGSYHIVKLVADSSLTYPSANIGDHDVIICGSIPAATSGYNSYWSTGTEGKDATVTITGGKMKIVVPEVSIVHNTDTLTITGTMVEN